MTERPTLTPAEYRKARAMFENGGDRRLNIARALDRYERGVREIRDEIARASR